MLATFSPLSSFPHFLQLLCYMPSYSSIHSFLLLFCPSWTLTVYLRNPAFSAVPWCPIATRFSPPPTSLNFSVPPPSLLPNLAPTHPPPPPSSIRLLCPPSYTFPSSPLWLGPVACVCWIRSLSKFGHAWQRRRAPAGTLAGWTGGLFSPPDPYIKLHHSLGIPVTPLASPLGRLSFSLSSQVSLFGI